ncbi:nitrilase-related carbon-nitrogen hydrolase [Chloroflexota bacterium]
MIQLNTAWHAKEANYKKTESLIQDASSKQCEVAVLPEMFNTGYSMEIEEIGEELLGKTSEFLRRVAAKYNTAIIAGYPVLGADGKGRNAAIAVDEKGNIIGTYFKMYSFSYADEHLHYKSGKAPVVFNIRGAKASVFICYELRFPEVFRVVAKRVDCIFVIANWPSTRIDHWNALLAARAIENQCYVVGVNRTGIDANGLNYPGNSHVFSPSGQDICTGNSRDELVIADIDLSHVAKVRGEFPFLSDMRISDKIDCTQ